MGNLRKRILVLLTAFAFLFPLIADAMELGHAETGGTDGIREVHDGLLGDPVQTNRTFEQAVYASDHSSDSDTSDSPDNPASDHLHCGLNLAGCTAMMSEPQRVVVCQRRGCMLTPALQFMIGLIPSFILPPPKHTV